MAACVMRCHLPEPSPCKRSCQSGILTVPSGTATSTTLKNPFTAFSTTAPMTAKVLARQQTFTNVATAGTAWIQVSSATFDLKAASSPAMASSGVFHPRVLRGRWFIRRATSLSSVWLLVPKVGALGEGLARAVRWCSHCCRAACWHADHKTRRRSSAAVPAPGGRPSRCHGLRSCFCATCVFRGDAPTCSDLMRPPVPISSSHRFRGIRPPL